MKHEDKKITSALTFLIETLETYKDFEDYLNRLEFIANQLNRNQEFHKSIYDELKREELNEILDGFPGSGGTRKVGL
jgi:hypothetical protein